MSKPTNRAPSNLANRGDRPQGRPTTSIIATRHIGPIPSADEFAGYEEALPGAADRILAMAEKGHAHVCEREIAMVKGPLKLDAQGQWFGFIITILALGLFAFLVYAEKPWESIVPGLVAIANLVAVFADRRRKKNKKET